jgi:hypothetical protein
MKYLDLEKKIGVHRLVISRARKRLFPNSKGEISPEQAKALTKELVSITKPSTVKLRVIFADDKYPRFVEATDKERKEKFTVLIPNGYPPRNFLGKEITVERRKTADDSWIYEYNPWNND